MVKIRVEYKVNKTYNIRDSKIWGGNYSEIKI